MSESANDKQMRVSQAKHDAAVHKKSADQSIDPVLLWLVSLILQLPQTGWTPILVRHFVSCYK